ncbi:MaoC/PaaZ C-terminal domain-containing protein [Salipiger abyssi]|uniref:MaoC/PaaZ C-terminal domain-containing protein n=1 Tax=Salipiger abyssi TaxID=1250539 RepID=UPI001A8ED822|nr:MaoC/PaaZ C-terminal domain-containing protein [Salipiger abyssi]MBN9887166.1 MaoC family dehydratase N-terminal domain-containing protein [Salipiger abyssi]
MSRYERLLDHRFERVDHRYDTRETILYALGIGAGTGDLDLINEPGLKAVPSLATVLAHSGHWSAAPEVPLDDSQALHVSERIELCRDIPVAGHVTALPRITAIQDRGDGRGAMVHLERSICDVETGAALAKITQRVLFRADGGIGGPRRSVPRSAPLPDRPADRVVAVPTSPRAAALYRLMGDDNPLHIDPDSARRSGFERPILHGLCSYGHICRALMREAGGRRLRLMDARFTAPVYPGETLTLEIWHDTDGARFRVQVAGRVVMNEGELGYFPDAQRSPSSGVSEAVAT